MNAVYEKYNRCWESIKDRIPLRPKLALILGSGLGDYADTMKIEGTIDYSDIEDFPVSTVPGHKGRFVFGHVGDVPVVVMQGRVHYYEGYPITDVVLPVRLMHRMGAETLFMTNAAGGVNTSFHPGSLMMITDHISQFIPSPLIGENIEEFGTRFPDMSEVYTKKYRDAIKSCAEKAGIKVEEGVYLQFTGPAYETPAEVRMARTLGADAVGMSTVCEAMTARHLGMKICGISCITNMACGITSAPLNHEEVKEVAAKVSREFKILVTDSIIEIGKM